MASAARAKSKKEEITVSLNGLLEELDELCTPSLTQTNRGTPDTAGAEFRRGWNAEGNGRLVTTATGSGSRSDPPATERAGVAADGWRQQ
ncbi:hypothetical protein T09_4218 [Trichinella sp. T9]|nr:hypothetical protein T09_4218 [Trichinella sp. T9]